MARQCAIIPKVLNNSGEKVDSRLFTDLLSYLPGNRARAVEIYQITKNPEFIQNWNPRLELDSNGEPTIISLLKNTNITKYIDDDKVLNKLNKDIGYYKKGTNSPQLVVKNYNSFKSLTDKAIKFNSESPFRDEYVAKVTNTKDSESSNMLIGIKVEKKDKFNSTEAKQMEYNEKLNDRLRSILTSHGISIGVLTELEERMGIKGVTDFNQAKAVAEGIVELIRLADGVEGEKVLPEEFAHFAIEALGSNNPLVTRLLNLIISNNLSKEIIGEDYEIYSNLYNGNEVRLAKEAAGKLLAKHLLQSQEIPSKPYKNLLQRIISSIKNFFQKLSASDIQKAMLQADRDFGTLASDILSGNLDEEIKLTNISSTDMFYNTSERIARDKKLLQDIIDNELKRLTVYEKRTTNASFSIKQQNLIYNLERQLATSNEIEGIYMFAEEVLNTLRQLDTKLMDIQNSPTPNINDKARVLRDVRNYLYSYKHIIEDIQKVLIDEEKFQDNRYGDRVSTVIENINILMGKLFIKYNNTALPLFVSFIKPFIGESIVVPFGKWKGKVLKAEDLVEIADNDISFFDRWLDSMADSSSYILKIMDQAVKKYKEAARLNTIDIKKQVEAATIKLEQAGVKNTDWMFEKDSNGNLSGRYIQEINYASFKEAKEKMLKELADKYGNNPVGEDAIAYRKEKAAWFKANVDETNHKPKVSIYGNKVYKNLSDAQKEYYNTIMEIKAKLDSYLPANYTTLHNAVKIRKDLLERVKNSEDVKSGAKQIWENVKDQFIRRADDTDFGVKAAIEDFEGNQVQTLPIYYTRLKEGESPNDISTDVASTIIAYAAMANDFNEMNKVIDTLELGRDMLRDNLKITKTAGNKPLVEKFNTLGRTVEKVLTKSKRDMRILERLDDFFEMQVYNRYIADEGTFGNTKIDKAKAINYLNRVTALNSLALNVLSGISNIETGKVMMRIESFAKEFFTEKDTIKADRIYSTEMPAFLAELGNRVKTSKLALWSELFNVPQDYETDVRQTNFDRKTWFSRMSNSSSLYFMNNAGEHWMQHRTSLALANRYKMKDPNGKLVSLWDAMEVVYIDPSNKKLGAKLQVKQGYTKEDGTEFTKEDIFRFSRKTAAINERMHGIYNKLDRNAIQRLAIGRMGMLFRKWIKPSLNRRFKSATYNFDLEAWTEGYYSTCLRFVTQLTKELKEGQFALAANYNNLTETEKANIRRAATEVGHFLLVSALLAIITWPDDNDSSWAIRMLEYQMRRLYTELGSMIPGHLVREGLKIVKSPAAGINTIEDTLNLIGLLNPYNYETFVGEDALIQSGRYKGKSKAIRLIYESPFIPTYRTIYRGLTPEEGIPFYK